VVLSYLAPRDSATELAFVVLEAQGWSRPHRVALGERWFVNWADVPSVVPLSADVWAAHWLVRTAGDPYAYDALVAVSRDGGRTWPAGKPIHSDGTATEHGFVSLYPLDEGVGAVWLDGRNLASDPAGATQLFNGVIARTDGNVRQEQPVDGRVCDCCHTDVAVTDDGPVVVYRDRSPEEIRDIAVSRWQSDGFEPGRPVALDGWQISGCPVNGPAVAADGSQVAVAWFTAHPSRHLSVAFSADGARTFAEPVDVGAGAPLGRVDVVLLESGDAVVSWLDALPGRLLFRRVSPGGDLGPVQTVADLSPERNAGFPKMVRSGGWLVFAWTDVHTNRIRSRRLPVPA